MLPVLHLVPRVKVNLNLLRVIDGSGNNGTRPSWVTKVHNQLIRVSPVIPPLTM